MAHSGVLGCARALHADLQKRRTLQDALDAPQHRGWTLIITGHSLGAGVATLLGLMLRSSRPELRVWAFSPPGGARGTRAVPRNTRLAISLLSAVRYHLNAIQRNFFGPATLVV